MAGPLVEFYTYKGDLRPFGNGTPIGYKVDPNLSPALVSGEAVGWDNAAKTLIRWTHAGPASTKFVGITRDSQAGIQKLGNQAALKSFVDPLSVFSTGIHEMLGTAGETYAHGAAVYLNGTDTTTITNSQSLGGSTGVQVGTVHLPGGNTITGAVRVPILIDEYTVAQV